MRRSAPASTALAAAARARPHRPRDRRRDRRARQPELDHAGGSPAGPTRGTAREGRRGVGQAACAPVPTCPRAPATRGAEAGPRRWRLSEALSRARLLKLKLAPRRWREHARASCENRSRLGGVLEKTRRHVLERREHCALVHPLDNIARSHTAALRAAASSTRTARRDTACALGCALSDETRFADWTATRRVHTTAREGIGAARRAR